jgi:hypothetical protein
MTLRSDWGPINPRSANGDARAVPAHEEVRRAPRSTQFAEGTLACNQCDAPVALADGPRSLTDSLMCPFCGHQGVVREFLSLAVPTRPTRVALSVVVPRQLR